MLALEGIMVGSRLLEEVEGGAEGGVADHNFPRASQGPRSADLTCVVGTKTSQLGWIPSRTRGF